jgi:hypothetical protein
MPEDLGYQRAAVYGELYDSAKQQMELLNEAIIQQEYQGFGSAKECAAFAKEHVLDVLCISKSRADFLYVTHTGDMLKLGPWFKQYGNVLFYIDEHGVKPDKVCWSPSGVEAFSNARVVGETSDGAHKPLYHRDYNVPTKYYDPVRGTFNVATPFPVFAKQTGRDTSHLYTYIEHIAGECTPWLLAWLRAKMCRPMQKTGIAPIIVSRAQGSGKSTFADVLCAGMFGRSNVVVTDQYNSNARFNSDVTDALVVSLEEKDDADIYNRISTSTLKSRVTAPTVRKENKGVDPYFQDSYTEFIVTTNKEVPLKFDDDSRQRRFMVMEADGDFIRSKDELAREIFMKLYGRDGPDGPPVSVPFMEDSALIAQFKHELYDNNELRDLPLGQFPETDAYRRCYSLPRTNEAVGIETIMLSLLPFIKASLLQAELVASIPEERGTTLYLADFAPVVGAVEYVKRRDGIDFVALCRPIIFADSSGKAYPHSTVERVVFGMQETFFKEGIDIERETHQLHGGFEGIRGTNKHAKTFRFTLSLHKRKPVYTPTIYQRDIPVLPEKRLGQRLRVNDKWRPDPNGVYETVNELKPGVTTLENKTANVQYMDTFLFESDEVSKHIYKIEEKRLEKLTDIDAGLLFRERLFAQDTEARRLLNSGVACRIVASGGKSIHILVRVKDEPKTVEEYAWLHAHLATTLSDTLTFDPSTHDPARLTRAPVTADRIFEYHGRIVRGIQRLIAENWLNVYDYKWRPLYEQWLRRPPSVYEQRGRKLRPFKPEYEDAMIAMLSGTFWTDSRFNGRRQQVFFPGYRLCRLLGFSHDELWSGSGILDGILSYYKSSEQRYWMDREHCDLIKQIDAEVDSELCQG